MNRYRTVIFLLLFMAVTLLLACVQIPPPVAKPLPVPSAPARPPDFSVANLKVESAIVSIGESVKVSAQVTNRGGAGDYKAIVTVDGVENTSKTIPVAASGASDVVFTLTPNKMGKYQVGIGGLQAALIVSDCRQKNPYSLQYDAGTATRYADMGMYGTGPTGQMTRFTPPAIPFTVQKILLYANAKVDNDWELDQRAATINLWDNKGSRVWSQDYSWRLFLGYSTWKEFTVPDIRFSGDFNVEFISHSDPEMPRDVFRFPVTIRYTCISLGFDKPLVRRFNEIPQTRSSWSLNGISSQNAGIFEGINWLIRVEGQGCLLENN